MLITTLSATLWEHSLVTCIVFVTCKTWQYYNDVIKWKHFPRYWPFVRGIHRFPVNSHHKGQWRGAVMFSLICAWKNGWVNNRKAGDLRRHRAHHDISVIIFFRHKIRIDASSKSLMIPIIQRDEVVISIEMALYHWYTVTSSPLNVTKYGFVSF